MQPGNQSSLAVLLLLLLRPCTAAAAGPAQPAPNPPALPQDTTAVRNSSTRRAAYVGIELLLRQITEECAHRQDSVLQLGPDGQLQVLPNLPPDSPCPPLDIALRGSERGVGICTDVALYVIHAGARIIPLLQAEQMQQYNVRCANRTARMFLETMYHEWHSPKHESLHLMQVNSEHLFKRDEQQHAGIDLFLCKTRFCFRLLQQHIQQRHWNSSVWYVGHTSSDVLVGAGQQQQQQQQEQRHGSMLHSNYSHFLHVRGKSGLKHSKQLLECWVKHPEFPLLTVIGNNPLAEPQTQAAVKATNIKLLPKPCNKTEGQQRQEAELQQQRLAAKAATAASTAEVQAVERAEEAAAAAAAAKQKAAQAKAAAEHAAAGEDQQRKAATQAAAEAAAQEAAAATSRAKDAAAAAQVAAEQAAAAAAHYTIEDIEVAAPSAASTAAAQSAEAPVEPAANEPAAAELNAPPPAVAAKALPGIQLEGRRRALLSLQHGDRAALDISSSGDAALLSVDKPAGGLHQRIKQQNQQQQQQRGALQSVQRRLQGNTAALKMRSLISFDDIRELQTSIGLHLCPSEREGFGHYLNEARAAGAFVITTDHPPMNEMIRPEFGVLVTPKRTESYEDWQVLAGYDKINAFLEPDDICAAVKKVLSMPVEDRAAMGRAARKQYLADKSLFVRKLRRLRRYSAKWRQHGQQQHLKDRRDDLVDEHSQGTKGQG